MAQPTAAPGAATRHPAILVVDDEESALHGVRRTLRAAGHSEIVLAADGSEALDILRNTPVSLMLLDLNMPRLHGEVVLETAARQHPDVPIIVVTADFEVPTIVRCMKLGAIDYVVKPLEPEQLVTAVDRALEHSALRYEASRLREQFMSRKLESSGPFAEIATADPAMLRLFVYLEAVSRGSQPVLIAGETGTGKELIARALHAASKRSGPFVAVNVAGLEDAMFADTLFGHRAGAFTGATTARSGMIERAGDGTLFLDEIGDLSEASQVKLLRLIQEREYFPLGSDTSRQMHARVVTATHRDPRQLRQDLYYRLRAYQVQVPPLRERLGDLPLLVERFLAEAAADLGKSKPAVPPELYVHLANHDFPGNVRELRSRVFDAVARHSHGVMSVQAFLDPPIAADPHPEAAVASLEFPFPMPSLRAIENAAVREAMRRVQDNQSAAARMLGVSRPTIARYLKQLG